MKRTLALIPLALLAAIPIGWQWTPLREVCSTAFTGQRAAPLRHVRLSNASAASGPHSAGFPPAVSPTSSRQAVGKLDADGKDQRPADGKSAIQQTGSYENWPGATVLALRESPPLDGLTTRVTLLKLTNFPYTVRVEEHLNQLEAPEGERVVHRREAVVSHLLAKLRPGQTAGALQAIVRQFGGRVRPHATGDRLYFVDLPELELEGVPRALAILSQYPEAIEYAEPDAVVRAAATTPNDPRFAPAQWGLNNTGQDGGMADLDIDAPEAWDIRREATNVIVAVVDSGIRYTHEDLAANMWRNPGETGTDAQGLDKATNGVDDDGDGFVDDVHGINAINDTGDPADDVPDPVLGVGGHGTSVAGVIGAVGNNGKGIAGVAWKVQLMALKWFNNQGAGALSDAIQCLDYARAKGASIVNASWQQGGILSGSVQQSMVDALERLRQAGIVFVSSAGNDGENNDLVAHYPSNYPLDNMVAVAAGTRSGSLSRKSNFGERSVDLVAPGEAILTTTAKADNDYGLATGTSFAAPHVSGILALLKAQFPGADYRALLHRLLASADRRDRLAGKVRTGALANLFRALTLATVPEFPEITSFTLNGAAVSSQEELSVTQGTNVLLAAVATGTAPLTYLWTRDGKVIAGATAASYGITAFATADIALYQVAVSNAAGAATLGVRLLGKVVKPEIAQAVDAPTRTFLTAGNTLWDSQNTVTRDGINAGASGRIAARQGTEVLTMVNGPGKASFAWKVSSERNNDTFDLLIDNVRVDSISGEVDWARKEYQISAGAHELRWRYVKDASLSKGADRGYLDQFQFEADAKFPPKIETQPMSQTVLEGSPVFFSVVASGSPPLSYQWQKDGANIVTARSNRLDLVNVTTAAEGRYSVIVSNEAGVVSSASARLTVTPTVLPPRIVTQPADRTADAGSNVTFTVEANGTPPLQYRWRKNGTVLAGRTNSSLSLSNLTLADSGAYSVEVSNSAGTDTSRDSLLMVAQLQLAPTLTKQPVGATVNTGERLELVVEAGGLGPFVYQWSRDGQVLVGEDQAELVRASAQPADAGSYQVRVSSPFGVTVSAAAQVRVSVSTAALALGADTTNLTWSTSGNAPWFRQTIVTFNDVDALQSGAIADFQFSELTTTVVGPGQVSFYWKVSSESDYDFLHFYVDDEPVDGISGEWDWEEIIWNVPQGVHTLTWFYSKDETVSAGADAAWLDQFAFVSFSTESPVVVRHPQNQIALEGGEATFEVEVLGRPPFAFQWFTDVGPIANATNIFLTLSNLSIANQDFYHVVVSNQFGQAASRVAYVYVLDASGLVDFTLNSPGLNWTDFGSVPWFAQAQETVDGVSAMQSGPIDHGEASWLSTAVFGPGILYFEWKVSSEQDYDFLEFLIDDQLWDYLSGEVDWQELSVLIPPGVHYLDWVYFKDDFVSSGADAGWLDYVQYVSLDLLGYWKNIYFTPAELLDDSISGDQADPDGDGRINLVEYAFDLDPLTADDVGLPAGHLETTAQGTFFVLTYRRQADDTRLTYARQVSTDLVHWTATAPAAWSETVTPLGNGLEEVQARYLNPISAVPKQFFRMQVVVSPP